MVVEVNCLYMQVTNLDYDEHKGRMAIGRVHAGKISKGTELKVMILSVVLTDVCKCNTFLA